MSGKRIPQRSCVVCRMKRDKRSLTRLVWNENRLYVDRTGKMNGRGGYLCADLECWQKARKTDVLARALRHELTTDDRERLWQTYQTNIRVR